MIQIWLQQKYTSYNVNDADILGYHERKMFAFVRILNVTALIGIKNVIDMNQKQTNAWNPEKIRRRYNYTCAKCGSAENIETHSPTGEHSDWRKGVLLCFTCHRKEHLIINARNNRKIKKIIPKETWLKAKAAAILRRISLAEFLTTAIENEVRKK